MQRNQLFKIIFVVALIVIALVSLYPSVQIGDLQSQEAELMAELQDISGLPRMDIEVGITAGDLIGVVSDSTSQENQARALEIADELLKLNTKIVSIESKSIRRGLDLQGGTYLVYEADLPQLLIDLADEKKDDRLEEMVAAAQQKVENDAQEFFSALQSEFSAKDVRFNRYFGSRADSDQDVIEELKKEADDAINRTIATLRNRIDQFGVSEPSITKRGSRRIEIELAGIQNIQRAKGIIGKTALLEFKLVRDPEMVWSILNDIDRVMRIKRKGTVDSLGTLAQADTAVVDGEAAEEAEVNISDLFGGDDQAENAGSGSDSTLLVDQNTFEDKPFSSLLRQIGGRYSNVISVPTQNVRSVQRILQLPDVDQVIPDDSQFLWKTKTIFYGEEEYQQLYLVKKDADLLGSALTDANVQISSGDQSMNAGAAEVAFKLNSAGTKQFAKVTGMNVGKQLAIVLDGRIAMAPNIKGKIPSGSGQIDGMETMEEAQDLALVLRAGALPAPVHPITENTVGPSLGRDSIQKGQMSVVIGLLLVIIFMIVYYKMSGVIADFALLLNIIFVLAFMAGFHATLTLPGIAGIILTVGMAVDANVLIFERIREELRTGKTIRAAIDAGYGRAFTTILDANITTLITAIVLYSFGTGAIKGFALTLSVGIVASMFTAIFVTRLVFDVITSRFAIKKLSI
jgi:SecD/SecF fusion protein